MNNQKSKGCAYLMDMGTGKTITTISLIGAMFNGNKIRKVLVVSPKTIVSVWKQEFEKWAAFSYNLTILEGSTNKKADTLKHLSADGLQIVVVNYESCWRLETEISKWWPDMIICDESSKIKNPQASCSKALHKLGKISKYNLILTGTPIVNSPLDFFSQYKFLDENIFGDSYYKFKNKYAIFGGYQKHQIIGYKSMAELVTKAHGIAYRVKLADAADLPETIDDERYVELDEKAQYIYKRLENDSYAQLLKGDVIITNVLTQLLRLSQLTGGFMRGDASGVLEQVSTAKTDVLEDIIDSCIEENNKVVVFARFIPEIDAIEKMLKRKKIGYALINGSVSSGQRAEEVNRFQTDDKCMVFIGQLATTSMGLTLTAAHIAIFYSLDFNYSNYEQSKARIHRIGQKEKCLYIHLIARNTIDEKIMKALKHKGDIAKLIIDDYKKILTGEDDGKGIT